MARMIAAAGFVMALVTSPASAADSAASQECLFHNGSDPANVIATCTAQLQSPLDNNAKVVAYFYRAYAHTELHEFDAAIEDLTQALALDPRAEFFSERAFVYNEIFELAKGEADLTQALAADPNNINYLNGRAYARHWQAKFPGEIEDRQNLARLAPEDVGQHLSLANAYLWTGAFSDAQSEIDATSAIADKTKNPEAVTAVDMVRKRFLTWRTRTNEASPRWSCDRLALSNDLNGKQPPPGIIGDCTRAFLDAATADDKSKVLTERSVGWLGLSDSVSQVEDLGIAAAITPNDSVVRFNFASAMIANHHSFAGVREADAALKAGLDRSLGLWLRGQGKLNLGDLNGALADAKESNALHPDPTNLILLGDIMEEKDETRGSAADYWLQAYKMGMREDFLLERLKKVGVTPPAN